MLGILRGDPQFLHVPSDAIYPCPSRFFPGTKVYTNINDFGSGLNRVFPIVKSNAPNERIYHLNYGNQRHLKCYVKFISPPSYIDILVILMDYITFLSDVLCL